MNYDQELNTITEAIKGDKSIMQPWRNYALKAVNEAQAFVRMGKTTSYAEAPTPTCTCPEGGLRTGCPIHGGKA